MAVPTDRAATRFPAPPLMVRLLVAGLAAIVSAGCADDAAPIGSDDAVLSHLEGSLWPSRPEHRTACAYGILGEDSGGATIYAWVHCGSYEGTGGPEVGGTSRPVVLAVASDGTVSHQTPRDGTVHSRDAERLFPDRVRARFADQTSASHRDLVARLQAASRARALSLGPP